MCTMSMVMDSFTGRFPHTNPFDQRPMEWPPMGDKQVVSMPGAWPRPIPVNLTDLRALVDEFKAAVAAAAAIDWYAKQPDCVDAEKGKLIDRVRVIEDRLAMLERETGIA